MIIYLFTLFFIINCFPRFSNGGVVSRWWSSYYEAAEMGGRPHSDNGIHFIIHTKETRTPKIRFLGNDEPFDYYFTIAE